MADQIYYSVFTKQGLALLTEAIQNGTKLGITSMAFGDGNGSLPVPDESFTKLVNEVHRTQLNSLAPDPNNANWLRAESIIASATGGFNIRELGLYAGDVLVAYSNYPATYKPNPSDGTARIMTFRMILQIDNTASFELKIDADVVLATIQKVEDAKLELFEKTVNTVNSIEDLLKLEPWPGRIVKTRGFYAANNFALAQPYQGGAEYIYISENSEINDGFAIFDGWTLIPVRELNVMQVGAKSDFDYSSKIGTDDTDAFQYAIRYSQNKGYTRGVYFPAGMYLFSDELNTTGSDWANDTLVANRQWGQNTDGCYLRGDGSLSSCFVFKPKSKYSVGISIRGGSGASSLRHISGISILPFIGDRSDTDITERDGIALLLQDCCFSHIHDVFVGAFGIGVRLNNFQKDGFTEFNRFNNVRIDLCDIDVDYYISADNNATVTDSFHGNTWNATQLQIRQSGGIGVRVMRESSEGVPVNCYGNKLNINLFGGSGCIAFYLERGVIRTASGDITGEGDLEFISKDTASWLESSGSYKSISSTKWTAPAEFSTTTRIDTNFAFRFNNIAKPDINFSGDNPNLAATDALKPIQVVPQFSNRPMVAQHNDEGLIFINRFDDVWGWGFGYFDSYYGNPRNIKLRYHFGIGGNLTYYGDNFTIKNSTYGLQFSANYKALMPQQTGKLSLGISSLYFTDGFFQNAITVVSDERKKTDISELNEIEIACAKACAKLYRRYKLKAAVEEKSETDARYHFGAIAQQIVQCFTDHGLDWTQYGIITYEKWNAIEAVDGQAATYDEDGQELTAEISAIEGREAGEIFMMRYEEFNCFVNAGMNAILTELEERLSKLESA